MPSLDPLKKPTLDDDFMAHVRRRAEAIDDVRAATSKAAQFQAIRRFYRALWPVMRATPIHRWAFDVYEIDWLPIFSPIEAMVWGDIREQGIVLYPQHPVAGYFVDFGHPLARVALECDGAEFHQDLARDAARQAAIEAVGWKVYRLAGSECVQNSTEIDDLDTYWPQYEPSPTQRLLRRIAKEHGLCARRRD